MLNCLSLLGASRSGKSAVVPLLTALKKIDLPFNTPDLDWYIEGYDLGKYSVNTAAQLCVQYMLCYSWYSYLGRYINSRSDDYYSLDRLKPFLADFDYNIRKDNDESFVEFLKSHENNELISFFMWDMPKEVYEAFGRYPINSNIIYCYRNPFDMVNQWVSSNRVQRSTQFSRMFKLSSVENLRNTNLLNQFIKNNRNLNEVKITDDKYHYFDVDVSSYNMYEEEVEYLTKFILKIKDEAYYWRDNGLLLNFEMVVSQPEKTMNQLSEFIQSDYDEKEFLYASNFMTKRPFEKVITLDPDIIRNKLSKITKNDKFIDLVIHEQDEYNKFLTCR